jgi:S-layer protein
MTKLLKKVGLVGATLAIAGLAVVPLAGSVNAATGSGSQTVNVTVGAAITVTTSGAVTVVPNTGSTADQKTATGTVTVATNNAAGYDLTAKSSSASANLVGTNDTSHVITPSATTTTNNTWAIKGGLVTNWTAMPGSGGTALSIASKSSISDTSGDLYTMTYGVTTNSTTPKDTYSGTVTYTATTK